MHTTMTFLDEEMIVAAANGQRAQVQQALAKGANIHARMPRTDHGASPGTAMLNAFCCIRPMICLDLFLAGDVTAQDRNPAELMTYQSNDLREPKMVMVAKVIGLRLSHSYATKPLQAASQLSRLECAVKLNHSAALAHVLEADKQSIGFDELAAATLMARRGRHLESENVLRSVLARRSAEAALAEIGCAPVGAAPR